MSGLRPPGECTGPWVRETDGYIVYIQFTDPASALTMNFDTYNKSAAITAP